MNTKLIAAMAIAAATFIVSLPAEAGNRKGGYRNDRHGHHQVHKPRHWNGHHNPYYGIHFDGYDPAYACAYFKRKARYTGSRYWWNKYRRCVARYY